LLPKEAIWKRTFRLVTHADWYRLRRVRAIWDFIRRTVETENALFLPKAMRETSVIGKRRTDVSSAMTVVPVDVKRRQH
jgi:hypothetical protein